MRSWLASALFAALLSPFATSASRAQATSAAAPLAFDVVSIKENPGPDYKFTGVMDSPDGLDAIESLHGLVADVFGVRREFVNCKLPLCEKPVYEIRAKVSAEDQARFAKLSWREKAALLQPVLKERFNLQTHVETRPTNVYDLVVAKTGSKLQPPLAKKADDKTRPADGVLWLMPDQLRGSALTLETFAPVLSQFTGDTIGRPVVDKTGLTGTYDIALKWSDPFTRLSRPAPRLPQIQLNRLPASLPPSRSNSAWNSKPPASLSPSSSSTRPTPPHPTSQPTAPLH